MYSKTDIDLIRHFKKIPRLANHLHHNVLRKMLRQSFMERAFTSSKFRVYYRTTGGLHYRVFTVFSTKSRKQAAIAFQSSTFRDVAFCAYASNLWNMFYYTYANCLDVSQFEVNKFPIGIAEMTNLHVSNLAMIAKELDQDLRKNAHAEVRHYKDQGDIDCYTVEMRESKPIIDKIDRALAKHYGFTEEELDFIINYDIKYRMGKGEADEDE